MMETVELTFQYSRKEFAKATRQYLFAQSMLRKFDCIVIPLFLLFSIFIFSTSSSMAFFIIFMVLLMMFCILYFYVPYKNFQVVKKLHDECRLSFSETSIRFNTAKISSEFQWSVFSEAWENKDFYFLIQSPQIYTLLPKRAFTPEQEETFKKILASVFPRIKQI